ncbi:hypothetical protein [Kutzneria sp. CA-103260]|uniref:hypothetical protein n=1 Tax=Kutzneria sp. CA-103260 TaxID=2802641 RepID=UPI001BA755D2|nr:hypothetical protein [Kutzneria sp. CA-103260]QUQ65292.1 hypothetical protein JJ691_30150 [Kutzneria sp. CA-103260]
MSPRGTAILASLLLAAGLIALAAGVGVALSSVHLTVQTPKGSAVVDCGRPWPPGAASAFAWQPEVLDAQQAFPDSTRAAAVNTWEADCRAALGLNGSLAGVLFIGGVLMTGCGGVLLLVRQRRRA